MGGTHKAPRRDGLFLSDRAVRLIGVMARVAGWLPDAFWAATPADVAAVLGGWFDSDGDGEGPLGREALAAMMEQYPDDR